MRPNFSFRWLPTTAFALAALLAACGDDEPSSGSGTDTGDVFEDAIEDAAEDVAADVADGSGEDVPDTGMPDDIADVPLDVSDVPSDGSGEDADVDVDAGPEPLTCSQVVAIEFDEGTAVTLDPAAVAEDGAVFDIGIQAGASRPESILLWTHIADSAGKTLLVWRESDTEGDIVLVHEEAVDAGPDGYTHVVVDGLAPCTWYSYAFFAGDRSGGLTARSPIGRFKTAHPIGSIDPVVMGATSCTDTGTKPWEALERTAEYDIDLFIHLGDQSYNDGANTRAEYRAAWKNTLTDQGYRAVHTTTSHLTTWDDHEVTNDWNPETISEPRLVHATEAYFETLAIERGPDNRLWESYRWGDTVEIWVTDNRGERLPSTIGTGDEQYISPAQMDWLKAGLLASDAHFKLVFSSVPITNMPSAWDLIGFNDRWEGYPSQRTELLDHIVDNEIDNVFFVAGDFHVGFVSTVEPSGPYAGIREIAVGPGGNGPNPGGLILPDGQFAFHTDLAGNEFVSILEFDVIRDAVRVIFEERDGTPLYDEWIVSTP
jgi:alkaline phosphatase D